MLTKVTVTTSAEQIYVSTVLTTTKTLLPEAPCPTIGGNDTYLLTEFYAGCGFQRDDCVPPAHIERSTPCYQLQQCAEVAANHSSYER